MSQKQARRRRQELRAHGIDTNKRKTPTPLVNRIGRPRGTSRSIWSNRAMELFKEQQAAVEAKPKRVRKTRSQQLAESMERHPAGKALKDADA